MRSSPEQILGISGCVLLLAGMMAPLYSIRLAVVDLYPVTVAADFRLALCFVILLVAAAWAVLSGRYVITAAAGLLVFVFTSVLHAAIENQMQSLAASVSDLGGGTSSFLGGFLGQVAGYVINTVMTPARGWYLLFGAGVLLVLSGVCGVICAGKKQTGSD